MPTNLKYQIGYQSIFIIVPISNESIFASDICQIWDGFMGQNHGRLTVLAIRKLATQLLNYITDHSLTDIR